MTERRRKTRKKDLSHGDLFHVYIASDTPPEVCEFLSRLKQRGDFSYEILQIIADHVKGSATEAKLAANSPAVAEIPSPSPQPEQAMPSPKDLSDASSHPIEVAFANEHTAVEKPSAAQADTPMNDSVAVDVPTDRLPSAPTAAQAQPSEPTSDPATEAAAEPVVESTPEPAPKMDPIQLLRQQRRAWVANSSS